MLELVEVMDRLRSPGGCPWDARQTHASLVPYLLEEAYETVEAIESGERAALVEELGDLLLQVVFHARLGQEDPRPFDLDEVAAGIVAKLIRRHPHVFADASALTSDEVEQRWQDLKAAEKGRTSRVDGIPAALPSLSQAAALLDRAERGGLPAHRLLPDGPAQQARRLVADARDPADVGDLIVGLVAAAGSRGWDAEAAARAAVRRLRAGIQAAEAAEG